MKKKILKAFNQSSSYRKFVNQRDEALERILHNTRLRIADKLNGAFNDALRVIQKNYKSLAGLYHPSPIKHRIASTETVLNQIFEGYAVKIAIEIIRQRRKAYTLAYAGEVEAIGQTLGKPLKSKMTKAQLDDWSYNEPFEKGTDILKTVDVWFSRLRRVMMNELELSIHMDDSVEKALGRIILKLPKKKHIDQARKLKKVPTKVREADLVSVQMIDPETWDQIVKDYTDEYVPIDRSPDAVFDALNPYNDEPIREDIPSDEAFYAWEVEQDTTHDFVQQVRDGQVDAANENGIDEFIWIAILDAKTCEDCCGDYGCSDFNGMLSSEIEKMTGGEYSVAPAHFNCRCSIAPASSDLEAYDNSPTERDFDEWLRPNG